MSEHRHQPFDGNTPTQSWEILTECLDAFLHAWDQVKDISMPGPSLSKFLLEALPNQPHSPRRMVLIELIKVDLEQRWARGHDPRPLESYLEEFPELGGDRPPVDLIYEEYHLRKQAGDPISVEECYQRFPSRQGELQRLLGTDSPFQTTSMAEDVRIEKIEPGQQLAEFDLLNRLGEGGFGQVFLAYQRTMQRRVALKVSGDSGSEPQTLAQLDHSHIVRVYDQRVLHQSEDDQQLRLLYMEYISGGTLQAAIRHVQRQPTEERHGRALLQAVDASLTHRGEEIPTQSEERDRLADMTWPEIVCDIGAKLARALAYAHSRGVLHRDIKPANVLLTHFGEPKLVDFNVSFASKLEGASARAFFGGSLAYMSPEQLRAFDPSDPFSPDELTGRADLFSLAVMLWELLTGERPFEDDFLLETWPGSHAALVSLREEGISEYVRRQLPEDIPPGLRTALLRALEPNPVNRPDADELATELELCLERKAQRLLHPPSGSLPAHMARFPLFWLIILGLVPNLLTALFNLAYNSGEIVTLLHDAGQAAFWIVQAVINGLAFPLGIGLFVYRAWGVRQAVLNHDPNTIDRRHALRIGHEGAVISLAGWAIAGVAYPLTLELAAGIPSWAMIHFLVSLILCGLMAVSYSFFALTFLSVRAFYPTMIRGRGTEVGERAGLERLSTASWFYLLLAAAVPMIAFATLVLMDIRNQTAMIGLSIGGTLGLALAFWLCRQIQDDLATLKVLHR